MEASNCPALRGMIRRRNFSCRNKIYIERVNGIMTAGYTCTLQFTITFSFPV